jgi:hypothetical protein
MIHDSDSKDNSSRSELLWEQREEKLLEKIRCDCVEAATRQEVKGIKKKRCHIFWVIPAMMMPIIAASINEMYTEYSNYSSMLMLISSLFNIIITFFNFGTQSHKHMEYATKYTEVADEIETELCKPRKHRIDCDLFLQRTTMKRNDINSRCPM